MQAASAVDRRERREAAVRCAMVVRGIVMIVLASAAACGSKRERQAPPPVTAPADAAAAPASAPVRWGGVIVIPAQPSLAFELVWTAGPPPTATLAIPAQKLTATALTDVSDDGTTLRFTLALPGTAPSAHAVFAVKRGADGATGLGTLHQHGGELAVRLERLADGATVAAGPPRPQEPKPPFPYTEREARYTSADGTALAGTLTIPAGPGPHPAVVLITGTGAQDRDETIMGHKPFWVLADHLSRRGLAVLRVDDRGVGGSGGDTAATDLDGKVADALAGVAWLRTQPEIDPARVGLVGHSEGGTIAPMAASRADVTPPIAFVVLLAAPGMTGREISLRQIELLLQAQDATPEIIARALAGQRTLLEAQARTDDPAELRAAVAAQLDGMASLLTEADRVAITGAAREQTLTAGVAQLASPASRSFSRTDPVPYLAATRCPVLALGGSLDLQVPATENLRAIAAALGRGGNRDVETVELPGLNHLFQPALRGRVEEYGLIDVTFDPAALDRVSTWLAARAKLTAPPP